MSGAWSQAFINKHIAGFIGISVLDIPAKSSGTVKRYFIYRATTRNSCAFHSRQTVNTMYIDHNGHMALWLTMMKGQQLLTLHWCSMSRWGGEGFTLPFAYEGGQFSISHYWQPVAPQNTKDTRPTTIDAPLTLIFMMGQGGNCNVVSYKGGQWFFYYCLKPFGGVITQEARPEIIDAPLTPIFKVR